MRARSRSYVTHFMPLDEPGSHRLPAVTHPAVAATGRPAGRRAPSCCGVGSHRSDFRNRSDTTSSKEPRYPSLAKRAVHPALTMPPDDGCRFDQYHGVEDLRPDSVKPHPEQPIGGEEPRLARALPTQDGHLVPQSNELKFQRGAASHPEREQGTDSGQNSDHANDGMAVVQ
jgi:hypothetical protein